MDVNVHPAKFRGKVLRQKKVSTPYTTRRCPPSRRALLHRRGEALPGHGKVTEPKTVLSSSCPPKKFRDNGYKAAPGKPAALFPASRPSAGVPSRHHTPAGGCLYRDARTLCCRTAAPASRPAPPARPESASSPRLHRRPGFPGNRRGADTYVVVEAARDVLLIDTARLSRAHHFRPALTGDREIMAQTLLIPVTVTPSEDGR